MAEGLPPIPEEYADEAVAVLGPLIESMPAGMTLPPPAEYLRLDKMGGTCNRLWPKSTVTRACCVNPVLSKLQILNAARDQVETSASVST